MSILDMQLGAADETTYGTIAVPTRFFEFESEGIGGDPGRVEAAALRPGRSVASAQRWQPYEVGRQGDLVIPVLTRGSAFWLRHMLGAVATTAGAAGEVNTHTATVADLTGKSFTAQVGRPFVSSGTVQPFTFAGGKVASWEIGNTVEEALKLTLSCDFQRENTATALAVASYPAGANLFSWAGCTVTVGGVAFDATDITLSADNQLRVDRRYLRGSSLKKEPLPEDLRSPEFELKADFDDLTHRDRVYALVRTGALAEIVARWVGPVQEGTSTTPEFTVTLPAARFDGFEAQIGGPEPTEQSLSGVALDDGTNSPVTIVYKSLDATP